MDHMEQMASNNHTKVPTEQRRRTIANLVNSDGAVNSEVLAARFRVSAMTIWRDIRSLEDEGKLLRVRGGAISLEEIRGPEPEYLSKRAVHSDLKEQIARYAAAHFVEDGDILILEAGTTVAAMVKYLDQKGLTILTNGVETIQEARPLVPETTIISCGGMLRDKAHTFAGPHAVSFFDNINARSFFLGATGLAFPEGITDPSPLEIQVKQAMAESAERIVLLLDSSKFGARSLLPILPLNRIDIVVTDYGIPEPYDRQMAELGIELHTVATSHT